MNPDTPNATFYHFPLSVRITMLLVSLFLALGIYFFTIGGFIVHALSFTAFGLLGIFMACMVWTSTVVDDNGIEMRRPFRESKRIEWDSITVVQEGGFEGGMRLLDDQGDSVTVNNQLDGYLEIVAMLREQRHDLFDPKGRTVFHRKHWLWNPLLLLGTGSIIAAFVAPDLELGERLLLAGLALIPLLLCFIDPLRISIEDYGLTLHYPFLKKHIARENVRSIRLQEMETRKGVRLQHVVLRLHGGAQIMLNSYREGDLVLYEALRRWKRG